MVEGRPYLKSGLSNVLYHLKKKLLDLHCLAKLQFFFLYCTTTLEQINFIYGE